MVQVTLTGELTVHLIFKVTPSTTDIPQESCGGKLTEGETLTL